MICPKCNQENLDKVRFCVDCGEPLTATARLEEIKQNNISNAPISDDFVNKNITNGISSPQTNDVVKQSPPPSSATGDLTIASVVIRDGKKYALGKKPVFSVILSLVYQGLGQFYNGDYLKGIVLIISSIVGYFLTAGMLNIGLWIYGMIDAYFVAKGKWPLW